MSNELDLLLKQKREIEDKIRELKTFAVNEGEVRLCMEHYRGSKPDRWYLGINVQYINYPHSQRNGSEYRSVINAGTREEVIEAIPYLIHDLQELYNKVVEK